MSSTWFAAVFAFTAGLGGAVERVALSRQRVLGIGLLIIGAALTLRR